MDKNDLFTELMCLRKEMYFARGSEGWPFDYLERIRKIRQEIELKE